MYAWPTAGCARSGARRGREGAYTMALEEVFESAASGYTEAVTEFHIVGGLHPDLPLAVFSGYAERAERAVSAGAFEGLHDGGDLVLRQAEQVDDSRCAAEAEGRGTGFDAGRRGGDLFRAGAGDHLRPQDRWQRMAGCGARGASAGNSIRTRRCCTGTSKATRTGSII